jgi:hypothetical protein
MHLGSGSHPLGFITLIVAVRRLWRGILAGMLYAPPRMGKGSQSLGFMSLVVAVVLLECLLGRLV